MQMKLFAGASAALICSLTAAAAADLSPPQIPYKAPPAYVAPYYNWTGFYIGANAGYGWGSGSGTVTGVGIGSIPISGSGRGFAGGVQGGYNYQMGSFVFGAEVDFQGTGIDGTFSGVGAISSITGTTKLPWFGTARGRVGYAMDRWLVYFTGGGALSKLSSSGTITTAGVGTPFSASTTAWSYVLGGGVEYALAGPWTVRAEYLYFGSPNKVPAPPNTTVTGSSPSNLVRAAVNYRF